MKTILYPIDSTSVSRPGVYYAQQIALHSAQPTHIILLHAYSTPLLPPSSAVNIKAPDNSQYEATIYSRLYDLQQELHKLAPEAEIQYTVELQNSNSVGIISQIAREKNADLIVVDIESIRKEGETINIIPDWIEMTTCPVLMIPSDTAGKLPGLITVAIDLESDLSPQFKLVEELARISGAEIVFLHVLPHNTQQNRKAVQNKFNAISQRISYKKVSFQFTDAQQPEGGILEFVHQTNSDLLVMNMHTHATWKDFFAASHTKNLATCSDLPLLVIHG